MSIMAKRYFYKERTPNVKTKLVFDLVFNIIKVAAILGVFNLIKWVV